MFSRLSRRRQALWHRVEERRTPLTPKQTAARDRWQRRWYLPILLAAIIPTHRDRRPSALLRPAGESCLFAGIMMLVGAGVPYGAEHPDNPGFATFGDSLWSGIVTRSTLL
jgi:hypothetical protein